MEELFTIVNLDNNGHPTCLRVPSESFDDVAGTRYGYLFYDWSDANNCAEVEEQKWGSDHGLKVVSLREAFVWKLFVMPDGIDDVEVV